VSLLRHVLEQVRKLVQMCVEMHQHRGLTPSSFRMRVLVEKIHLAHQSWYFYCIIYLRTSLNGEIFLQPIFLGFPYHRDDSLLFAIQNLDYFANPHSDQFLICVDCVVFALVLIQERGTIMIDILDHFFIMGSKMGLRKRERPLRSKPENKPSRLLYSSSDENRA